MRDAHALSKRQIVDPAYSARRRTPAASGSSVFGPGRNATCWLYLPGDLEAALLIRLRHEAFRACCYVGHPGRFRSFSAMLYARRAFSLRTVPRSGQMSFCFSGVILLTVNGKAVFRGASEGRPAWHTVDIRPCLKSGDNQVSVRLHQAADPPTFVVRSPFLRTDADWQVSQDSLVWSGPGCVPFAGLAEFPHHERLPSIALRPVARTGAVYDFGAEVLGRPRVQTTAAPGAVVLQPGESAAEALNEDAAAEEQTVDLVRAAARTLTTRDELALRFLRVSSRHKDAIDDVELQASLHPVRYRGAFACSDERLNRIWMRAAYTLRLCMRECFVDGIKRDRMGWVGDLYLSLLGNGCTFAERDIERRSLTALYGADPAACEFNGIIDYTLLWVIGLWTHLLNHDDRDYLNAMREKLHSLMAVLESKEDAQGLLPSARFSWIFIDWAPLAKGGHSSCLQLIYVLALDAASRIARADGDAVRAACYARKAARLRRQCRALFWDAKRRLFVDNRVAGRMGHSVSRHANFLAFLSGTIAKGPYVHVVDRLERDPHAIAPGTPYMMAMEGAALCRAGRPDRLLAMLRDYWGGMLDRDATTFWEAYDPGADDAAMYAFYGRPFGKSLCHAWSAGPAFLLSGELLGIRPLEPGWRRFTVAPDIGDLAWACATMPTPLGDIKVEVEGRRVSVRAPRGAVYERSA